MQNLTSLMKYKLALGEDENTIYWELIYNHLKSKKLVLKASQGVQNLSFAELMDYLVALHKLALEFKEKAKADPATYNTEKWDEIIKSMDSEFHICMARLSRLYGGVLERVN